MNAQLVIKLSAGSAEGKLTTDGGAVAIKEQEKELSLRHYHFPSWLQSAH